MENHGKAAKRQHYLSMTHRAPTQVDRLTVHTKWCVTLVISCKYYADVASYRRVQQRGGVVVTSGDVALQLIGEGDELVRLDSQIPPQPLA